MTPPPPPPRARSHPRAIAAFWAWQAAVALVAAWPGASLVRAAYGGDPRGDAPLWEPGGSELLDFLWRNAGAAGAAADGALLVVLVGVGVGLVAIAGLMVALERPAGRRALPRTLLATLACLPAFVRCAGLFLAAQAATLGAGAFLGMLAEGWTRSRLGEGPAQVLGLGVGSAFLLATAALGVMHDLARAVVVVNREKALGGVAGALRLYRAAPGRLTWAWAWRTGVSMGPVAVAGAVASSTGAGGGALVLVAAAHQGAALGRVALRASWLAFALRAAGQDAASDR